MTEATSSTEWRNLTVAERAVFDRLFEQPFEGRDALMQQVERCIVRSWESCLNHCPSLDIKVPDDVPLIHATSPLDVYAVCMDAELYGVPSM